MEKTLRFNSSIQAIEKVNPMFSRAIIKVLYTGNNRNGSHISKEVAEQAVASIYNIPIVGEYIEETENFGDHGNVLEISEDSMKMVVNTKPYGVVPESANVYWENIAESDGTVNEYLIVDGVYLWTGRYDDLTPLLSQSFGQSMEIEVVNAKYAVIDKVETFKIEEFIFSALCILGVDKNGEGHVEPAFASSNITTYSLDKADFKKQFNQMVAELKFSMQEDNLNNKGGDTMTKEKTQEVVLEKVEEAIADKSIETVVVEQDFVEADVESTETEETVFEGIQSDVQEDTADESEESVEESSEDVTEDAKFDSGDVVVETAAKTEEVEEVDFELKYIQLVDSYSILQTDFDSIKSQFTELQTYKRQRGENDLKDKFTGKLSNEEFTQVFTELKEEELDKVEEKLFALIGKKNFSIQSTEPKVETNKVKINHDTKEESTNPYDALFTAYLEK